MAQVTANGINIEYDTFGERGARPLLLVMGLGAQMIAWRGEFCQALADRGHFVVRYDNRDVGLSQKFGHLGLPDMMALMSARASGEPFEVPYTLSDMVNDGLGLLDVLDIEKAHICGASMGGMIVQAMAISAPQRVLSMTSIMSSTGNPDLPPATEAAMAALMTPGATTREGAITRSIEVSGVIGSPKYPAGVEQLRERAEQAFDRCAYPEGVTRQMAAVFADGNRKPALQKLDVAALIVHGQADPLVPVTSGIDTHEALMNAELMLIDGMGHDLPEQIWNQVIDGITNLTSVSTSSMISGR
ncbi:MAG: alpha/beta hydrolase [Proteobacteria bacterium]|nr:alpha/beta hydrolase [Pseudomonadota bacterium]